MTQTAESKDMGINNSRFYMLRCIVAMAHADDVLNDLEIAYISGLMNHIPLSQEQKSTLITDLNRAQDVFDLLRHINDPSYRSQIIHFARLMAYKDGHLHPNEEEILEKLHIAVTDGLDIDAIKEEAKKAARHEMLLHDIEIDKHRPQRGDHFIPWLQILDEILLEMGIDLIRE